MSYIKRTNHIGHHEQRLLEEKDGYVVEWQIALSAVLIKGPMAQCSECWGSGRVHIRSDDDIGFGAPTEPCRTCSGTGSVIRPPLNHLKPPCNLNEKLTQIHRETFNELENARFRLV